MAPRVAMICLIRPPGPAAGRRFVQVWHETVLALRREPGFVGAELRRNLAAADEPAFVALAYWRTARACRLAVARHADLIGVAWAEIPVEAQFGIYAVEIRVPVHRVRAGGPE